MLPLWSFKDERAAKESSNAIFGKFVEYKKSEGFVGMDVARKFLQMGYTRAMRYAKREAGNKSRLREKLDPEKEKCAAFFREKGDPSPKARNTSGSKRTSRAKRTRLTGVV